MKNLILSTTILFFGQFTAQCVKLYVKAHLSGSPICQLSEGNYIEICENDNEVNGCPRDFYVYDKGSSYGSFTYELSLDKGWSTHYMTLMVNPTTKRFGFILQGQTAMYSYYTEAEMESNRASQAERERIINQNRIEQAKALDEKTKIEINSALEQKEYFKALQLFSLLNYKDDGLLIKINEGLLKIENQKREQDKFTALKVDSLLSLQLLEDAAFSYDQLNFTNLELKNKIQSLLEKKHENDTVFLDKETVLNYINYQINTKNTQLLKLVEGEYEIIFNTTGKATNVDIPNIGVFESNANIPSIKVGSFEIKQHSKMALKITLRDSILILSNFSSGCTKTIYVDKNEKFYLKTKTGLPTAYFSYNYKLDESVVRIYKAFKQEKYINGVVAESMNYTSEQFKKILEKEK